MIIDTAKYTCPGGHEINEDSFLCRTDRGIFIVADGLGGHSEGETASSAAIGYFDEHCHGGYTEACINALLEGANEEVLSRGDGGKTTVAAAFIENGHFGYANVGDSRVYYFRNNRLIAQTKDHSVCQASVDMGLIRPEDIRGSEDRARLLKVLGSEERLNIKKHYAPLKIQNGDAFLVCSDGFWDFVYESEMEADLLKSDSAQVWLKYLLKRHILRGQNKGDNYTVICGIIHMDADEAYEDFPEDVEDKKTVRRKNSFKKNRESYRTLLATAGLLILLILALVLYFMFGRSAGGGGQTPHPAETADVGESTGFGTVESSGGNETEESTEVPAETQEESPETETVSDMMETEAGASE